MSPKLKDQISSIVGTYIRAFVAGATTAYAVGATAPSDYVKAGIASVLPILMRWANPKDSFPTKK